MPRSTPTLESIKDPGVALVIANHNDAFAVSHTTQLPIKMASAAVMSPAVFSTALPSVPTAIPSLPRVGTKVRVTTTLGGLTLEGMLVAVNLFQGTLTMQTARFQQPLTIQVGNINHMQELVPATASMATQQPHVEASEVAEALAARQSADGVQHLVSAVKAVSLSPILSALPSPDCIEDFPESNAPASPAMSASSATSASSGSSLRASSSVFKSSSVCFVPNRARVPSPPPAVYRTTSAPAPQFNTFQPMLPPSAVSMLPPPGMGVAPRAVLSRSVSYGHQAMHASMAAPVLAAPVHPSPPRVQQPSPQQLPRARSVSPARSTGSASSLSSGPSSGPSSGSSTRSKLPEVCKYFNTPKGCSRGTACRYRHAALPAGTVPVVEAPSTKATTAQPSGSRRTRRRNHSRRHRN